jgi:phosphoglucomutase
MSHPEIHEWAQYWATSPVFDQDTRSEIATLIQKSDTKELTERFYKDLEFGTGGLRGILGPGRNRMNLYNVRRAAQALATYVKETFPSAQHKIAISFDSRNFSKEFAQASAEVFAGNNIQVKITKELRPVPMLSFMVRHYGCHAGVCITASHNPPNYNGFKAYWQTGGQIVPPHDKQIIQRYDAIKKYDAIPVMPFAKAVASGLVTEVGKEFDDIYFKEVEKLSINRIKDTKLKIVYSPLHGAGGYPVHEALKRFGFTDITLVPEQAEPNGAFPTVKFPNPEDIEALSMAMELGRSNNADLIIGTDPDCDRLGMVVKDGDHYWFLNGNEMGCLLTEYMMSSLKEQQKLPANPVCIKTIVTSDLQRDIAEYYGAHCDDTLTGFKWIAQLIEDYNTGKVTPKRNFVCGGEESYGFMAGSFVRDKDGISASCIAAEMVAYYKSKNKSLRQVLNDIYRRHGVYRESLYTLTLPGKDGADRIDRMMSTLRKNLPTSIGQLDVKFVKDYQQSQGFTNNEGKFNPSETLTIPRSNVLQFILADHTKVSIRPSGTEPKIKFYISVKAHLPKDDDATLAGIIDQRNRHLSHIEKAFTELALSVK